MNDRLFARRRRSLHGHGEPTAFVPAAVAELRPGVSGSGTLDLD